MTSISTDSASNSLKQAMKSMQWMEQLTSEQKNQLLLKKMTLELDLNASQQKEMSKIITEQSAKRETKKAVRKGTTESVKKQLTADALFAKKSMMLNEQIVMKKRIKKILSSEQSKKWDDMKGKRHHEMNKRTKCITMTVKLQEQWVNDPFT